MKSHFLTGYRCNLAFFVLESLAITVIGYAFERITMPLLIGFVIFAAVMTIILFRGKRKFVLSEDAHKMVQELAFLVISGFASIAFDSAQVFIYAIFFNSVVSFIFLDPKLARRHMVITLFVIIAVAAFVSTYTRSRQTMLEYTYGSVVVLIANWVIISMTNIIMFQYRKSAEQERSLDDLLKVVEAKCDDAQAATIAKTRFLANMSHEIRTPINSIMGMNEMILRESSEREILGYANESKSAAESLLSLVNDILDITKIEEGKVTLVNAKYRLASLINDVYSLMRFRAESKALKLEVVVDETLPSVLIGDDVRLKQVLTNLLTNAVKYTHEGTVTLEVRREGENEIYFSVRDTGIGIKEENIDKLFDAFARFEEVRNRSIEGTGLGLNITVSLLKLLGSELKVNSVYGIGSDFYFVLRQKIVDNTPVGKLDLSARCEEVKAYKVSFIAPEARILVVDDNEINRKVFTNLLKKTQIQIDEAESGYEALEKTSKKLYDIVFMDHMMPEMDGIETFHALRENKENLCHKTPVIALTANAVAGAREYYLGEGFDNFLSKPIDTEKLEKLIFEFLDKKLIQEAIEEKAAETAAADENDSVELPAIDGIDWNYARMNLKDDALVVDTAVMFRTKLKADIMELDSYFENIDSEDGCDAYRVKVHSMKSSAALIGIILLAGMAMELEKAARNKDTDTIKAMHVVFANRWNSYYEMLSEITKNNSGLKPASEHMDEIQEIFTQIHYGAENMDVDVLDEMSKLLDEYSFEKPLSDKIEMVKMWILGFELDKLSDCSL